ncbi:Bacterial extracellular solute-binding protein [Planctomycetes bacterium Pla163]|uniref:Bacterial extracellular solute-binding protein n=1 Tax=Rohdeia mirabilis TaxID=2528008 RepID=A0A518D1R4_9BACT|nr:Bacterial extracellular solute-binding protein [Planctomycetes bacterium Pla163]
MLISRRNLGIGLGAVAAGYALWPRRARWEQDVPAGRVALRYWEKWTGEEGAAMQRVVDRFNASQDRIFVVRLPVAETYSKAMVAIGGGDPPDLVGLFSWNVPYFAQSGALLPLDGLDQAAYPRAIWELLCHEGRAWVGVNTCYSLALYSNRAHLAEVGADPERPPRTLTELDAVAERLVRRDARGRLERAGFLQAVPNWWPYLWPLATGGRLFDDATHRVTCDTDACVAAYEWVSATAQRHGRLDSQGFARGFDRSNLSAADPFLSGQVSMIVQGPWMANVARSKAPDVDYVVSPMPVAESVYDPERPQGLLEADVIGIPRGCPHPEEALEFLAFTQRPDVQAQLCSDHCKPSPLVERPADFEANHPNPYVDVHERIVRSPAAAVLPRHRAWKSYSDLLVPAFERIWTGADPRTELAGVAARAQGLVDRSDAAHRAREARG